jgi:hypothetical protein
VSFVKTRQIQALFKSAGAFENFSQNSPSGRGPNPPANLPLIKNNRKPGVKILLRVSFIPVEILPPVSLILVANWPPVSTVMHLYLRIPPQILGKI